MEQNKAFEEWLEDHIMCKVCEDADKIGKYPSNFAVHVKYCKCSHCADLDTQRTYSKSEMQETF